MLSKAAISRLTVDEFLYCPTPDAWIEKALKNEAILLIDHANCEKKAAATALNLMTRYIDRSELLHKMSRLAREELRHFEQVFALMQKRGIDYEYIGAARYASGLRKVCRTVEPKRLIDTLIIGAYIEARSCERFCKLAPHLDDELKSFYQSLFKSEERHFHDYLTLAQLYSEEPIQDRIVLIGQKEQELIETPDDEFRFHSGV